MTVCESDSGLCRDLDEETLARAILTFCLNTADALMTALLKGTADAWEALTLIRDSDPELRTSAGAEKVIEQAFCIGMTRWGSKPTPQAVRLSVAAWKKTANIDRSDPLPGNGYTNLPVKTGQQPNILHARNWLDGEMRNHRA